MLCLIIIANNQLEHDKQRKNTHNTNVKLKLIIKRKWLYIPAQGNGKTLYLCC